MHLTLIISSLGPGGAERVLSELANYWTLKGHQISLITLASPKSQPFYLLDSRINLIQLNQNQTESSTMKRVKNILKRLFCLRKAIHQLKPDVIVSFIDIMNVTTLIATMGLKIPVVVSERIDPNFHSINKLYTWLRLRFYPFSQKIIVQTKNSANYFPSSFRHFIKIIPNPVVIPKNYKINLSKKVQYIVTVGRLSIQKDHVTLIHAFSNVLKIHPDLTLTIYGEGSERTKLEGLITSLSLQHKVHLPGTTKNIHEALMNADLFIFPSRYEGFPNALCEAMAIGLPVIASNCSGNVDIVRDGVDGRLFPVGNIDALTNITLQLLDDPQQCARLAEEAKKVCNRFHPDHIFTMWDQVIDCACDSL